MNQQELEAAIADLEEVKLMRLKGKTRRRVSYEGTMTETELPTLTEINQALAEYRLQLAQITGAPSRLGPVRFGFGGRY